MTLFGFVAIQTLFEFGMIGTDDRIRTCADDLVDRCSTAELRPLLVVTKATSMPISFTHYWLLTNSATSGFGTFATFPKL